MKVLRINAGNLRKSIDALAEAARVLKMGGAIVYPTDTVYGLGCDATNTEAVERVFKIKKRPKTKAVPMIIKDMAMAKKYAWFDSRVERVLDQLWPGPITVVLKKRFNLPDAVTAGKMTLGMRIPDYKLVNYLVEAVDIPLVATSANISNQQSSRRISEVLRQFEKSFPQPDLILEAGNLAGSEPSTVLDLSESKPKIIRIGPVSPKKLMEILAVE